MISKIECKGDELLKVLPKKLNIQLIAEFDSPITIRAVVIPDQQGALFSDEHDNEKSTCDNDNIERSALLEAENIAKTARQISQVAIDIGNKMASEAEKCALPLNNVTKTMGDSPDEKISRFTYSRARGPDVEIFYPDGKRRLGGNKQIPASTHSKETFELSRCYLTENKPGSLTITPESHHEGWQLLQKHTPGIQTIKNTSESTIFKILKLAANAGIPVDMTVCVTETVKTKERCCTPISIQNKQDIFTQGHLSLPRNFVCQG